MKEPPEKHFCPTSRTEKTICICGGGALGHVIAGTAAARGFRINLLSEHAENWSDSVCVSACDGKIFFGKISEKSKDSREVIPAADFVLLCVPGNQIRSMLKKIVPALPRGIPVGCVVSSSGFFFAAREILPAGTPLFGFQRVPYIARVSDYGKSAELLGYKKELRIAFENFSDGDAREAFRREIEILFDTPTFSLNSFWDAALTNSNPLLHPCRLYGMWKDWDGETAYAHQAFFYEDWDDFSSEILIRADEEFFALLRKLPVTPGAISKLLDYYECDGAHALTCKLRSIPAFQRILAPMRVVPGGFVPDVGNRYFIEDIPFGMKIIKDLAVKNGVVTPTIDRILAWSSELPPPPLTKIETISNTQRIANFPRCDFSKISKGMLHEAHQLR